jgi:hypothetical protein
MAAANSPIPPVHLTLDSDLSSLSMLPRTFISSKVNFPSLASSTMSLDSSASANIDRPLSIQFIPIVNETKPTAAENVALDLIYDVSKERMKKEESRDRV